MRHIRSKRGFDANQMFVYVISIVIVALTIIIGVKVIGAITGAEESIKITSVIGDLSTAAEKVAYTPRSQKVITVSLPSQFNHMCFLKTAAGSGTVNPDVALPDGSIPCGSTPDTLSGLSQSVCEFWKMANDPNYINYASQNIVFIDDYGRVASSVNVPQIDLADDKVFICSKSGVKSVKVALVGQDRRAMVRIS